MSVQLTTTTPNKLLNAFKKAIDERKIVTWSYDHDGDFTHTPDQWKGKAWLRPTIQDGSSLTFGVIKVTGTSVTREVFGIYQGRLIETMVIHCNDLFTTAQASPNATSKDNV